jgi:predicted flap endonuclease-1-like 5' DNA nuclease
MAKLQNAAADEKQAVFEVRSRYYQALRDGVPKEQAFAIANGEQPYPKKRTEASAMPTPQPQSRPKLERKAEPDDLMKINGIGANTVKRLNEMGVSNFAQIASWSQDEAKRYDQQLGLRGRIVREDWVGQAKELVK